MPSRLPSSLDFDIDNSLSQSRARGAAHPQPAVRSAADLAREAQVLYLTLLAQGGSGGPITELSTPVTGDKLLNTYTMLLKNNTNNPIRVQVFANLVTPGCGVVLSFASDASDAAKFDELSLTANGRTESVTVILLPTYSIWGKQFALGFPAGATDVFRMRVFDPQKLINISNLYPHGT